MIQQRISDLGDTNPASVAQVIVRNYRMRIVSFKCKFYEGCGVSLEEWNFVFCQEVTEHGLFCENICSE